MSASEGPPPYEFTEEVTSDISFVARGATPEAAFEAASEALLAATLEDPGAVASRETLRLELEEPDLELLLLRFVNELVYLRDARDLLLRARSLRITRDGDAVGLTAELAGETIDRDRHRLALDVKAATAHGLAVVRDDRGGWEARVTLDV